MSDSSSWIAFKANARAWIGPVIIIVGVGLTSACSIVGATGDLGKLFTTLPGLVGVGGIAAAIVGTFVDVRERRRVADLEAQNAQLRAQGHATDLALLNRRAAITELFRAELSLLAKNARFRGTDRISLYKQRADGAFRLVGRFSLNGTFDKVHREVQSAGEGLVHSVSMSATKQFEEVTADPDTDLGAYCAEQAQRFNIPESLILGFAMKSRSYAAFPIPDYAGSRIVAVIVFESITPRRFAVNTMHFMLIREVESALEHLKNYVHAANENQDFVRPDQR